MRYLSLVFITVVLALALAALANKTLDPFGVWRSYAQTEKLPPQMRFKPGVDADPRFAKPLQVIRLKPKTIIVGSSRVRDGMDPAILHGLAPAPIMNYGVAGMRAAEGARFIRHAIETAKVSHVIWGLDFFGFNDRQTDEMGADGFGILTDHLRPKDAARLLIAWPTALYSSEVIDGKGITLPDGFNMAPATAPDKIVESIMRNAVGFAKVPFLYGRFDSFAAHMQEFEKTLAMARAKGVRVYLYTSPLHALVTEAVFQAGAGEAFFAWKAAIAALAEKYRFPLYDYMNYNVITMLTGPEAADYFFDGAHFTPTVSRMILARYFPVASARPAGFGPALTTASLDESRKKLEHDRKIWTASNHALVKELIEKIGK